MKNPLDKYRNYRDSKTRPGVIPIGLGEWIIDQAAGKLIKASSHLATKRGDMEALSAHLMVLWVGNEGGAGKLIHTVPPRELARAMKSGRLRIVMDQETSDAETKATEAR